jgi:hypothetical protein
MSCSPISSTGDEAARPFPVPCTNLRGKARSLKLVLLVRGIGIRRTRVCGFCRRRFVLRTSSPGTRPERCMTESPDDWM